MKNDEYTYPLRGQAEGKILCRRRGRVPEAAFRLLPAPDHRAAGGKAASGALTGSDRRRPAEGGRAIRAKLPPNSSVAALCVEGRTRSSEELAGLLRTWEIDPAKHLVFLIGGSYGLDEALKREAWVRLSMSPMTFPHHLARVMLLEQIYRGFKINEGSRYHK